MGEQSKAVTFQGPVGQVPAPASAGEQAQGSATPKYVTLEEAQELANKAAEEAYRKAQGLIDKTNQGTLKKVRDELALLNKGFEALAKAGHPVPPEEQEKLRNQSIQNNLIEPESSPAPEDKPQARGSQPAQAGAPEGDEVDPVTAEGIEIQRALGVKLEDGDPEIANIKTTGSIREYLTSIEAAAKAKLARLGPQNTPPPARAPTNLGAQGQHNPNLIEHINNPDELITMGLRGSK